jgi:O-antigen ligase
MAIAAVATTAWYPRRFQDVLRTILTWLVVASVILVIVDPDDAIHGELNAELKDAWRGVTIGKNVLGSIASTAVILWLHAWMSKAQSGFKAFVFGGLAALCLAMSRSSTSLMATAFAVMFMLLLLRSPGSMRRYMPYLVGIFATIILVYCLAILRLVPGSEIVLSPIAAITGKDLTFTGRTAIWQVLNEHIKLNPWLGTGYGAYWIGATPESPSFEMLTRLFFYPTEGHNGYLDVINDLGAVGGLCLLGYFITYVRQSLWLMKFDRYQGGLYLTMLFRGFIADMSESHWFLVLSIDFAIMTMATMALARSSLQANLDFGARYRPAGRAGNLRTGAR